MKFDLLAFLLNYFDEDYQVAIKLMPQVAAKIDFVGNLLLQQSQNGLLKCWLWQELYRKGG